MVVCYVSLSLSCPFNYTYTYSTLIYPVLSLFICYTVFFHVFYDVRQANLLTRLGKRQEKMKQITEKSKQ